MSRVMTILAAAAALSLAVDAQAAILQYVINGRDTLSAGQVEYASFQIDTDRLPDGSVAGIGFFYAAVPGTFTYGTTTTTDPQDISFYLDAAHGYDDPASDPGGLFVGDGDLLGFSGPQLFTGAISQPTLMTGTFTLADAFSGSPISLSVTALPEPAGWMMMIAGFGVIGSVRRRGRPSAGWIDIHLAGGP